MSDLEERKPYPIDMSDKEVETLEAFIRNNLPGIHMVKPDKVQKALELYLQGYSYNDISSKVEMRKIFLLYLSYKENWYEIRRSQIEELAVSLNEKTMITKIKGIDLISQVMGSLDSYYRDIVSRYRNTGDARILETADMENMKLYLKMMEQLQKITEPKKDSSPLGLNLPNGGTIKKVDNNTIEVRPNEKAKESLDISKLAEIKRKKLNET